MDQCIHCCIGCACSQCNKWQYVLQDVPYILLNNSNPQGAHLLQIAHDNIVNYLMDQNITLSSEAMDTLPTLAYLSVWDQAVSWVGGAWGVMKVSTSAFDVG